MRKLFIMLLVILLLLPLTASAQNWFLACDIPSDATIVAVDFRVNGGDVQAGDFVIYENDLIITSMMPYLDGAEYEFESRFINDQGKVSWWSVPFAFNANQIPPPEVGGPTDIPVLKLIQK